MLAQSAISQRSSLRIVGIAGAQPVWIVDCMEAAAKDRDHILLVEDDPQDEVLILQAFRKLGLSTQVVVSHDGAEALDYLFGTGRYAGREPLSLPQFVLMDIALPKFNGVEALDRIRADIRSRYLPVIIFTSSLSEKDLRDCYRSGANSYVRKPDDFAGLVEVVRQIWLYWAHLNQPPPQDAQQW
jgi:two-component system response regulator